MAQGNREVILDRKQAVMLGSGVVLALVLVFVLGVLFGRNMADRKGAKDQSRTAEAALAVEQPKPVPAATVEAPAAATGETAIKQKIEQQKVPAPKIEKNATVTKPGKPPAAPTKEAAKPATTAKPAASAQPPAKPAPTTGATAKPAAAKETAPATTKSGPVIQVAAFPDKASAEELTAKLKASKWPAFTQKVEIPGKGTFYRVCLGPYANLEQAKKALVIFKSKEPKYQDAFVRR